MREVQGFLIVRADGDIRAVKRRPRLGFDEVAFPVTVTIPITWGQIQATSIEVTMPEPPEALVRVGDPELAHVDDPGHGFEDGSAS